MRIDNKSSSRKTIVLQPFDISSQEFFRYLEDSLPADIDLELKSGTYSSENRVVLENLGELRTNLDKVASPFDMKIGSVNFRVGKSEATLDFEPDGDDEMRAIGLQNWLRHHHAWIRDYRLHVGLMALIGTVVFSILYLIQARTSIYDGIASNAGLAVAVAFLSGFLFVGVHHHVVRYRPRETFWQRNKDKILVGSIMLLLGATVPMAFEALSGSQDPIVESD